MPKTNTPRPSLLSPEGGTERIRARADSVGAQLAESFRELLARIPGAPLGPKLLAERYDLTVGTASRMIRAIAESSPIDLLQGVPGPVPLKRFIRAIAKSGAPARSVKKARAAVDAFDDFIRESGGSRRKLDAVLSNWQPRTRKQFVLSRRQSAFKAFAELKGVSSALSSSCIAMHRSEDEGRLDVLRIASEIGIQRTNETATAYFGTRRQEKEDTPATQRLVPETLDGSSILNGLHTARLDEFCEGDPVPIETVQYGQDVIHMLGRTELLPDAKADLVLAEVYRRARSVSDPVTAFLITTIPSKKLNLDLLIHEDVVPSGRTELLVYSLIPRGPVAPGDPSRAPDLEPIPETLEIHSAGIDSLHIPAFPRYVEVLRHSFEKLGWDSNRFCSWRLQVDFPPYSSQFCILLGRGIED